MIKFVYQNKPRGTGDAVLKCSKYIKSNFFLMLLPDDLIIKKNCTSEMIKLHKQKKRKCNSNKKSSQKKLFLDGVSYLLKKKKKLFSNYRCS